MAQKDHTNVVGDLTSCRWSSYDRMPKVLKAALQDGPTSWAHSKINTFRKRWKVDANGAVAMVGLMNASKAHNDGLLQFYAGKDPRVLTAELDAGVKHPRWPGAYDGMEWVRDLIDAYDAVNGKTAWEIAA